VFKKISRRFDQWFGPSPVAVLQRMLKDITRSGSCAAFDPLAQPNEQNINAINNVRINTCIIGGEGYRTSSGLPNRTDPHD